MKRYQLEKRVEKSVFYETWTVKMKSNDLELLISSFLVRGYRIYDTVHKKEVIRID